ncbi:MAG: DUF86 domain-containing protein [Thioalkalivibrio sp.]|nr:DUF86 domain-containing protein [Thioalkalivibrio sp.]
MSAQPRDRLYLQHILDAILRIGTYLEDLDREEFDRSSLVQDAVIRQLQIIGEASKRLSEELKRWRSSIPWRQVTGMRDKLTHDYMGVDLDAVWKTAVEDLVPLKVAVQEELQRAGEGSNGA